VTYLTMTSNITNDIAFAAFTINGFTFTRNKIHLFNARPSEPSALFPWSLSPQTTIDLVCSGDIFVLKGYWLGDVPMLVGCVVQEAMSLDGIGCINLLDVPKEAITHLISGIYQIVKEHNHDEETCRTYNGVITARYIGKAIESLTI
ncbi:MAG TPA: hypothetical protein VIQ31_39665, partial [Phormidium sp.]